MIAEMKDGRNERKATKFDRHKTVEVTKDIEDFQIEC